MTVCCTLVNVYILRVIALVLGIKNSKPYCMRNVLCNYKLILCRHLPRCVEGQDDGKTQYILIQKM